jgi:hypothetical protein
MVLVEISSQVLIGSGVLGEVGNVAHACDVTHSHDQMRSAYPVGERDVRLKASNKGVLWT